MLVLVVCGSLFVVVSCVCLRFVDSGVRYVLLLFAICWRLFVVRCSLWFARCVFCVVVCVFVVVGVVCCY